MAKCTFCGVDIPTGRGTMYVKKDAKILWFCSGKCEKNMLVLKRKARTKLWTVEGRNAKEATMAAAAHKAEEEKTTAKKSPAQAKKAAAATRVKKK